MATSAPGTRADRNQTITDASGNQWSINGNGQVTENGAVNINSSNVIALEYGTNGVVYQENYQGLWWGWQPNEPGNYRGWLETANGGKTLPAGYTPNTSPNNTEGSSIVDANGNGWGIWNGQVTYNGIVDQQSANVIQLAWSNGKVYQENFNGDWWAKSAPIDTWSPGPGVPTDPTNGQGSTIYQEGWYGGYSGNSVSDNRNWGNHTQPSLGQTIRDFGGHPMVLNSYGFQVPVQIASTLQSGTTPVFDLNNNSSISINTDVDSNSKPIINANGGTDALSISNAFPSSLDATVNIAGRTDLLLTGGLTFGGLTVNGPGQLTINDTLNLAGNNAVLFNAPVNGTGTVNADSAQGVATTVEVTSTVSSGVMFNLSSDPARGMQDGLIIDHPAQFAGSVTNLADAFVELKGLVADSYTYANDLLTLFKNGAAIENLSVATTGTLNVEQGSAGVMLSNSASYGNDGFVNSDGQQPGGPAAKLTFHSMN